MKFIRRLLILLCLCVLCAGGFFAYQGYTRYETAVNKISIDEKVAEVRSNPSYTSIGSLPKTYLDAVVAVEDKRFYEHPGFDVIGIARAIKNNIQAGNLIEGGSTITQQLAKNLYLDQEQSLTRKFAEGFLTLDLERKYTKKELLELYVNSIYFGDGYYCIADASAGYFGKSPQDMNDYESTMLAGVPNAPSVYAPTVNLELARSRQKKVIQCMVEEQYISKERADTILMTGSNNL